MRLSFSVNAITSALDSPADSSAPRNVEVLDGVRGIAALLVFVSHMANLGWLPSFLGLGLGKQGVALFFILSGFLMAYLYADMPFGWDTVERYARNRVGRILPLYFAVVLACWLVTRTGLPVWVYPVYSKMPAHLLMLRGQDVLWSIPVEFQFYFVFLGIWYAVSRSRMLSRNLAAAAGGIMCLSGLGVLALSIGHLRNEFLPFWMHFFLIGAVSGILYRRHHRAIVQSGTSMSKKAGLLLLLFCVLTLPGIRKSLAIPALPTWLDPLTISGPILFFALAVAEVRVVRFLRMGWCKFLGRISFAFYLFHMCVLQNLQIHLQPADGLEIVLAIGAATAVTVLLSVLSLNLLERPAQQWIRSFARDRIPSVQIPRRAPTAPDHLHP